MKSMRLQDDRTWAALSKHYSLAEQAATKGFSTTVLFEPFGGHFGVTRTASREFNWTNSQPLDRLDGYDLLSPAGEELLFRVLDEHDPVCVLIAFDCRLWSLLNNVCPGGDWEHLRKTIGLKTLRLVKRICEHQWKRGRYFVVENPATSVAWRYHRILTQILEKFDGKYVICDQCRYGQRDSESGKLIRKPTGWLSNSEPILNHAGKRCQCPPGEHQQVWVKMPRACAVVRLHATHQLYVELFAKVCYRPWSWTMPVLVLRVIWLTPTFQNPMPRERTWRLKSPWMVTIGSSKAMR